MRARQPHHDDSRAEQQSEKVPGIRVAGDSYFSAVSVSVGAGRFELPTSRTRTERAWLLLALWRRGSAVRARIPLGCCARLDPQRRTRGQSAPRAAEGPRSGSAELCAQTIGTREIRRLGLVVGSSHARGRTRRASPVVAVEILRGAVTAPAPGLA